MNENNLHSLFNISNRKEYTSDRQLFNNQIVWLDSKEAAEYLRISVANLRVKVSRGEVLVNGRLGKSLRFRREELDKLLEASFQGASQ